MPIRIVSVCILPMIYHVPSAIRDSVYNTHAHMHITHTHTHAGTHVRTHDARTHTVP